MANEKQDGSNLLSLEATTGRCKVGCELCFVNLGQQGNTVPLNILHPWKAKEWYDEAKTKGWKPPPKDPTPKEIIVEKRKRKKKGKTVEVEVEVPAWRLGLATVTSATMIPKSNKAMKPSKRKALIECNDGTMLPPILRVSSMSDSSLAPKKWLEDVRDMWGDYCFFNSNIRAINRHPNLTRGVFHKLVTTMNGGYQSLPKPTPRAGMVEATGEYYKALSKAYKKDFFDGYKFGTDTKRDVLNSMGKAQDEDADFWNPVSLSDIGLEEYEDLIKFYRLRVCPTIWADPHTDRPVVCTVLRFKSAAMLFEFARRYKLKVEVLTDSPELKKDAALFKVKVSGPPSGGRTLIRLWTDANDSRNASPYAGQASEYVHYDGFYRPINKELLDYWPLVCDRENHSCKGCGLCATVDGTEPEGISPIMAEYGYYPDSWQTRYVMKDGPLDPRDPSDWFELLLLEGAGGGYRSNPGFAEEADLDWVEEALQEVAIYNLQGESKSNYCVEGWNTHEDVTTLTAYCYWVLLRAGRRAGLGKGDAITAAHEFVDDATGGINFMWDVRELELMWDDDGPWVEQFGTTRV